MRIALVLALLLAAPAAILAAPPGSDGDERRLDCNNVRNAFESYACADAEFRAADVELNDIYRRVLAHIAENGGDKPYDSASWTEAMKVAQRAWVAFRDADCKGVVPVEWSGGRGSKAAVLGCMREKTRVRTQELAERYGLK